MKNRAAAEGESDFYRREGSVSCPGMVGMPISLVIHQFAEVVQNTDTCFVTNQLLRE